MKTLTQEAEWGRCPKRNVSEACCTSEARWSTEASIAKPNKSRNLRTLPNHGFGELVRETVLSEVHAALGSGEHEYTASGSLPKQDARWTKILTHGEKITPSPNHDKCQEITTVGLRPLTARTLVSPPTSHGQHSRANSGRQARTRTGVRTRSRR